MLRWLLYTGIAEVICNPTPDGHYYVGHVSMTVSGRTCQAWSSQSPHTHTYSQDSQFADVTVAAASNYCRNPSSNDGPWCYTTDPAVRWENCDVLDCGQSSAIGGCPYSIAGRKVAKLIPILGSQPAGDVSHKPGGRLPLLSARPAVTLATLRRAAANFAAW